MAIGGGTEILLVVGAIAVIVYLAWGSVTSWFGSIGSGLSGALGGAANTVQNAAAATVAWFGSGVSQTENAGAATISWFGSGATQVGSTVGNAVGGASAAVQNATGAAGADIQNAFSGASSAVTGFFGSIGL